MTKRFESTHSFDKDLNCIFVEVHGAPTSEDLIELLAKVYKANWYQPDLNEIWDFSGCKEMLIFTDELMNIEKVERDVRFVESGLKSALVGSDMITRQSLRDYVNFSQEIGIEAKVFDSLAEAKEWISS